MRKFKLEKDDYLTIEFEIEPVSVGILTVFGTIFKEEFDSYYNKIFINKIEVLGAECKAIDTKNLELIEEMIKECYDEWKEVQDVN